MFKGHEDNSANNIEAQIEPYRNVVVAYETDQRLQSLDVELLALGYHAVTSNDRYQYTAAYLALTRNHARVIDAVADSMTKGANTGDLKADHFTNEVATDFLLTNYQATSDGLEDADRIFAIKGFKASPDETLKLQSLVCNYSWLSSDQISRRFLSGAIDGLRSVNINTRSLYRTMTGSNQVPNSMRQRLSLHIDPLLAAVDGKLQAIDRITANNIQTIKSEKIMFDLYQSVTEGLDMADQVGIWLTVPKLFDASFTLSRPLDELRIPKKSFDAASLGGVAVQKNVASVPKGPQKSFDPDSLRAPSNPTSPKEPAVNSGPAKPFNPDILGSPKKSFDATDLGKPAVSGSQEEAVDAESPTSSSHGKGFNPDDLK